MQLKIEHLISKTDLCILVCYYKSENKLVNLGFSSNEKAILCKSKKDIGIWKIKN